MPTCKLFKTNHNTGYNNLGKKKDLFDATIDDLIKVLE